MAGLFDFLQPQANPMMVTPPAMPQGGMDASTLSNRIQELLGAKEPNQGGMAQDILSGRFAPQPSLQDEAVGIMKSAPLGASLQTGQDVAASNFTDRIKMLNSLSEMQKNLAMGQLYASGGRGSNGATMAIYQEYLKNNPDMDPNLAMSLAQKSSGPGAFYNNGIVTAVPGASEAAGIMQHGKEAGGEQAKLEYAAPIEQQKIIGKGEITPVQQKAIGQNQVDTVVGDISSYYDELNASGAAVNTANDPATNFMNYTANTGAGQFLGKVFGTNNQSIRNKINQAIPSLINSIRQTTGMSAKAMDSNAELKFYLQQATDPTLDISANKAALARIQSMYGSAAIPNSNPALANSPQITREQALEELRRRGKVQ